MPQVTYVPFLPGVRVQAGAGGSSHHSSRGSRHPSQSPGYGTDATPTPAGGFGADPDTATCVIPTFPSAPAELHRNPHHAQQQQQQQQWSPDGSAHGCGSDLTFGAPDPPLPHQAAAAGAGVPPSPGSGLSSSTHLSAFAAGMQQQQLPQEQQEQADGQGTAVVTAADLGMDPGPGGLGVFSSPEGSGAGVRWAEAAKGGQGQQQQQQGSGGSLLGVEGGRAGAGAGVGGEEAGVVGAGLDMTVNQEMVVVMRGGWGRSVWAVVEAWAGGTEAGV